MNQWIIKRATAFFCLSLCFFAPIASHSGTPWIPVFFKYERPGHVPEQIWNEMEPYFLPYNHPLRKKLDSIFKKTRALASSRSLKKAGFSQPKPRKFSHAVVSKHESLKNVVVKLFTDDTLCPEWPLLLKRIKGSISLKKTLELLGYENEFKVPRKWIYPLPPFPVATSGTAFPKNFILISEDMELVSKKKNFFLWFTITNESILRTLYHILETEGLSDSVYPFNLPFSKDGKIAFIDLEYHHTWPIPYHKLLSYLRPEMQTIWQEITNQ